MASCLVAGARLGGKQVPSFSVPGHEHDNSQEFRCFQWDGIPPNPATLRRPADFASPRVLRQLGSRIQRTIILTRNSGQRTHWRVAIGQDCCPSRLAFEGVRLRIPPQSPGLEARSRFDFDHPVTLG